MQTKQVTLTKSYLYCQNLTQKFAKSFYFATNFLPAKHKPAIYAIYAFCRYTDDLVDENEDSESNHQIEQNLLFWQKKVDDLFENGDNFSFENVQNIKEKMILIALNRVILDYKVNKSLFLDLFRGISQDLKQKTYKNFEELDEYCYLVAGVVGLIMVSIVGYSQEYQHKVLEFANKMGKALQITNILRDIKEDFGRGRIYLPQEDLNKFGYSKEDLAKGIVNENFRNLIKFYIKKARKDFSEAWEGFDFLVSGSRLALKTACRIYIQILEQIEKADYDVFSSRIKTSFLTKINLLLGQIFFPKKYKLKI
jgi:15-cis-phytoene synthase